MSCQKFKDKLALYIDNQLDNGERAELENHLSKCPNCARELAVLKSIDSLGKVEAFSEPEPEYWNQLNQNIMQQIEGPKRKRSSIPDVLDRLKAIILPQKMSYRIVGLAATAVIVFFIVHISFFRNGKFEVPVQINTVDTVKIFEPETPQTTFQKEMESEKEILKGLSAPTIIKSTQDQKADIEKKQELQPRITIPQPSICDEEKELSISTERVAMATAQDLPPQQPTVAAFDQAIQIEQKESVDKLEMKKTTAQPRQLTETRFSVAAISNRSHYAESDSSLNHYQLVSQFVESIPTLNKKIDTWEKYLKTNPEIELAKKAKSELAMLYDQLVATNPTRENIQLAFTFYSENLQILGSMPDSVKFREQYEELQELHRKNEKNK